jgi:hypothetical protein
MPVVGLRVQAYQLLGLAVKADQEGRSSDAYGLTARAIEHLEDAMSVDRLRRISTARPYVTNTRPRRRSR